MMIYLLITLFAVNKEPNYEVLYYNDPKLGEVMKDFVKTENCVFNSATIYHLTKNRYVIFPSTGDYRVLYYRREVLDEHIKNKYFPVNELEEGDIFEKEKKNIEKINSYYKTYVEYVESKFCVKYPKNIDIDQIENHIGVLQKNIDIEGFENLSQYDILTIGVYISSLFKYDTKTEWNLDKVFTLNTYWVANLISQKGDKYDLIGHLYNTIYKHKFCDLMHCYRSAKAQYYKLGSPLSEDFLNYVTSGKLPD